MSGDDATSADDGIAEQHEDGDGDAPEEQASRPAECPTCSRDLRNMNAGGATRHMLACSRKSNGEASTQRPADPDLPTACPRCLKQFAPNENPHNMKVHFQSHIPGWSWNDPLPGPDKQQRKKQATLQFMFAKKHDASAAPPAPADDSEQEEEENIDREDGEDVEEITCPIDQPLGGISPQLRVDTPSSAMPSSLAGNAAQQEAGVVSPMETPGSTSGFSGSGNASQHDEASAAPMSRVCRGIRLLDLSATPAGNVWQAPVGLNYPYHLHALAAAKRVPPGSTPTIIVDTQGFARSPRCSGVISQTIGNRVCAECEKIKSNTVLQHVCDRSAASMPFI